MDCSSLDFGFLFFLDRNMLVKPRNWGSVLVQFSRLILNLSPSYTDAMVSLFDPFLESKLRISNILEIYEFILNDN